jgi:hypothetical protein
MNSAGDMAGSPFGGMSHVQDDRTTLHFLVKFHDRDLRNPSLLELRFYPGLLFALPATVVEAAVSYSSRLHGHLMPPGQIAATDW